jgi:sensor histidine kinase YesM
LVHYVYDVLLEYPNARFTETLFLETHLFAPIFLAAFVGQATRLLGIKRFSFLPLLFLGLLSESLLSLATLISTWAPPFYFERFTRNVIATPLLMMGYWAIVKYQLSRAQNTLALTQQELSLVQAELRTLRAQINPHFLLNSLSVIHHLIRTKPDEARNLVLDLSDIFQRTLRAGDFVPLGEEIEHVKSYLALEKARLTNRLTIHWSILAEDKLGILVPTLILQPIVENAVQHGIAPQAKGGILSIVIQQRGQDILIEVADNGVGFEATALDLQNTQPGALSGASMGLRNIDYRLRLLYGDGYRIELDSTETVGTTVRLRIPSQADAIRPSLRKALTAGET